MVYLAILLLPCIIATFGLCRSKDAQGAQVKEDEAKAEEQAVQMTIRAVLLRHFRDVKRDRNRMAVLAYSEAIQRITRGEHVPIYAAIYIANQLEGGEVIAEELKGVES